MAKIGGICEQQSCKRFKEFYNQFIFETSIYKAEVKFVELRQSITSTCLIAYLAHVATNHSHLPDSEKSTYFISTHPAHMLIKGC